MGDAVSVMVSSSVVTEGVDVVGKSSANTRVGFGAVLSHGKIGLGRSFVGGVVGALGYLGAWNSLVSADILYTWFGKFAASGRELDGGAWLIKS